MAVGSTEQTALMRSLDLQRSKQLNSAIEGAAKHQSSCCPAFGAFWFLFVWCPSIILCPKLAILPQTSSFPSLSHIGMERSRISHVIPAEQSRLGAPDHLEDGQGRFLTEQCFSAVPQCLCISCLAFLTCALLLSSSISARSGERAVDVVS